MRLVASPVASISWFDHLRAGRAFGQAGEQGAVAAEQPHVQLFNPLASGVICLPRYIGIFTPTAQVAHIRIHNTALTTLTGQGVNLLSGGAAGQCASRAVSNAGDLGTRLSHISCVANETVWLPVEWFCELGAGEGILVNGQTANTIMRASWYWVELPQ